jgi:pyridoxamine 5'-phosphate oxidase
MEQLMETKSNDKFLEQNDPFKLFQEWMLEAKKLELNDPDAIALATVSKEGKPNVRMVLLRYLEKDSFVFFSNYNSSKGQEIKENENVAFVCHWKTLRRQVRVRGVVSKESGSLADTYFKQRSLTSKLGAWASKQSKDLKTKDELYKKIEEMKLKFNHDPPRPEFWGGFRIQPLEIEFWMDGKDRLHDRFAWTREKFTDSWTINRLYP